MNLFERRMMTGTAMALLAISSGCGKTGRTNSPVDATTAGTPSQSSTASTPSESLSFVDTSRVDVPAGNTSFMNAIQSVAQIQISKPSCRNGEPESVTKHFCAGTVITYGGKPYLLTAAHCLASECFSPTVKFPSLGDIKIPKSPQIYNTTTSSLPSMDSFDWSNGANVLQARDVEFVSVTGTGGSFTGNTMVFPGAGGVQICSKNISASYPILTTLDMAVIDFGPSLATYPMMTLPSVNFSPQRLLANSGSAGSGNSFLGVGFSNNVPGTPSNEQFTHFQKGWKSGTAAAIGGTCANTQNIGVPVSFYSTTSMTVSDMSFAMADSGFGCHGDSGGPAFEDKIIGGVHVYELAGVASTVEIPDGMEYAGVSARCKSVKSVTYSSIKPAAINVALAKIAARTVSAFPGNYPKDGANKPVDLWAPNPANQEWSSSRVPATGMRNSLRFIASSVATHTLTPTTGTVLWAPLTKSTGLKPPSQSPGATIDAIATNGTGTRTASWKATILNYGYWTVDMQFPLNVNNASCVKATYTTNPLRATTTINSKVITLLPEGSSTVSLGAYSANELQVGDPVSGTGIPVGATVAVAPASRTATTFQISAAATATSAATGMPLTITRTFRNLLDERTGYSVGADVFTNGQTRMLPFKASATSTTQLYENYIWVPPIANSTNAGNVTVTISDKGCGTATASAGRMVADSIVFTYVGGIK